MIGNASDDSNVPGYGHPEVLSLLGNADDAHLTKYSDAFDVNEVTLELTEGLADVWMGTALIDYEQPAGNYTVNMYAQNGGTYSNKLTNYFTYMPVCGIEVDFTGVNFGNINIQQSQVIGGDQEWDTSPGTVAKNTASPGKSTVRNIGNTWAHVTLAETAMGFGYTGGGPTGYQSIGNGSAPTPPTHGYPYPTYDTSWNVYYDAQMGSSGLYKAYFTPNKSTGVTALDVPVVLANYLGLSTMDKLDLSIYVFEGGGEHFGTLTLGCTVEPFSPSGTPSGVPDP